MFQGKKITLYISGGIAAYKMANFARSLIKQGAEVRVAMTEAATAFITPLTFQVLTKHPVMVDVLTEENPESVAHIEFAQWADYAILSPATANSIAKLAQGIADNFVSTALLAHHTPIFIVPAMNDQMYSHPATQRNIKTLQADGHYVMEPDSGFLAEGYEGKGRLPDEEKILETFAHWIRQHEDLPLKGKKFLISAGGTVERIDPVRYISNDSSGRMGHALAEVTYQLGADVQLVTSSQLPSNANIHRQQVSSAKTMLEALDKSFDDCHVLIMAAAVSDYRPHDVAEQKIKKKQEDLILHLEENPDILKYLGQKKNRQILVGFAAETNDLEHYAKKKLKEKNLDLVVANNVAKEGAGFNVSTNEVTMFKKNGEWIHVPQTSKQDVAKEVLKEIQKIMEERND